MSKEFREIDKGVKLKDLSSDETYNEKNEGSIYRYNNKIKALIEGSRREILSDSQTQTVTNKSIDADNNTVSNLENDNIKANAGIDASKIGSGSVSTAEYDFLNGVTGNIQNQINTNSSSISTNTADILTNTNNIANNSSSISVNAAAILVNQNTLVAHTSSISTNSADILTNTNNISANSSSISTNSANILTNTNNISNLSSSISTNSADILTNSNNISILTSSISTNSADILTNAGNISNLSSSISTNSADILTNSNNISNLSSSVSTNAANILTNSNNISANTSSISQNSADILTNANNLSSHASASVSHNTTGEIVGTSDVMTLTNKTFDDEITFKEIATPTAPSAGYVKYYPKSDGKFYKLDSADVEAEVGSGSSGGGSFDFLSTKVIGDFNTYKDADQAIPEDGTGGTPTHISVAEETVTPIDNSGKLNLTITNAGSTSARGEGVSVDFSTRGLIDRASKRFVKINALTSSGYVDGDLTVFLYDLTNSTVIYPANQTLYGSTLVTPSEFGFQLSSDSDAYRLIIHSASENTVAYTVTLTVEIGEIETSQGATDIYLGELTTTGSWTTNTTYVGKYWQRGDKLIADVAISLDGAPTSTTLQLNVPHSIDTTKLAYTTVDYSNILKNSSTVVFDLGANVSSTDSVTYISPTVVQPMYFDGTTKGIINATTPITFASGDVIRVQYEVPIQGWSSNMNLSSVNSGRTINFFERKNGDQTITAGTGLTTIIGWTKADDSVAIFDTTTGIATISETRVYSGTALGFVTYGATAPTTAYVEIVGSTSGILGYYQLNDLTANAIVPFSLSFVGKQLIRGETVALQVASTGQNITVGGTYTSFSLSTGGGNERIASDTKSYVKYSGNGGTSIVAGTTDIDFDTKIQDTDGLWDGSKFTPNRSGNLNVKGVVNYNATGTAHKIGLYIGTLASPSLVETCILTTDTAVPFNFEYPITYGQVARIREVSLNGTLSDVDIAHWISITLE